jgi:flagellar assembly factor FliW
VKVMTARFGEIEIGDDKIIEMPDGMIGFPDRRFIMLSPDNNGQFFWLQSAENPELAFVVTDPATFAPGYEANLTSEEYMKIRHAPESELILLAVVTMAQDVMEITLNLQGPIVVNPDKMIAKQMVLEDGKYGTRHPLFAKPVQQPFPIKEERHSALFHQKITAICCNL